MESGKRKREEPEYPLITFYAPDRTFERLFKETSLSDIKDLVRKKLGLPSDAPVDLTQLRGGKTIDLEDTDDFDAFRAFAHSNATVEVRVTVPTAAQGDQEPNIPHVVKSNKKTSSAPAVLASPSMPIDKLVQDSQIQDLSTPGITSKAKPKKLKALIAESSAASCFDMAEGETGRIKKRSEAAGDENATTSHIQTPDPNSLAADDRPRKKRKKARESELPAPDQQTADTNITSIVPLEALAVTSIALPSTTIVPPMPKRKRAKSVSNIPIPVAVSAVRGSSSITGVGSDGQLDSGSSLAVEAQKIQPLSEPPQKRKRAKSVIESRTPTVVIDSTFMQGEKKSKKKKAGDEALADGTQNHVKTDSVASSGLPKETPKASSKADVSGDATIIGIMDEILSRRARTPADILAQYEQQHLSTRRHSTPGVSSDKAAPKKSTKAKLSQSLTADPDTTEATPTHANSPGVLPPRLAHEVIVEIPNVTKQPQVKPKSRKKPEPRCPICLTAPHHLHFRCPVVQRGSESIKKRLEELQVEGVDTELIKDLGLWYQRMQNKEQEQQEKKKRDRTTRLGENIADVNFESSPASKNDLNNSDGDSSNDTDTDDNDNHGSKRLSPSRLHAEVSIPFKASLPEGLTPNDIKDIDLEAIMRGPGKPLSKNDILSSAASGSNHDREDEDGGEPLSEDDDIDDEEEEERIMKFRRRPERSRVDSSSAEEEDDFEEGISWTQRPRHVMTDVEGHAGTTIPSYGSRGPTIVFSNIGESVLGSREGDRAVSQALEDDNAVVQAAMVATHASTPSSGHRFGGDDDTVDEHVQIHQLRQDIVSSSESPPALRKINGLLEEPVVASKHVRRERSDGVLSRSHDAEMTSRKNETTAGFLEQGQILVPPPTPQRSEIARPGTPGTAARMRDRFGKLPVVTAEATLANLTRSPNLPTGTFVGPRTKELRVNGTGKMSPPPESMARRTRSASRRNSQNPSAATPGQSVTTRSPSLGHTSEQNGLRSRSASVDEKKGPAAKAFRTPAQQKSTVSKQASYSLAPWTTLTQPRSSSVNNSDAEEERMEVDELVSDPTFGSQPYDDNAGAPKLTEKGQSPAAEPDQTNEHTAHDTTDFRDKASDAGSSSTEVSEDDVPITSVRQPSKIAQVTTAGYNRLSDLASRALFFPSQTLTTPLLGNQAKRSAQINGQPSTNGHKENSDDEDESSDSTSDSDVAVTSTIPKERRAGSVVGKPRKKRLGLLSFT